VHAAGLDFVRAEGAYAHVADENTHSSIDSEAAQVSEMIDAERVRLPADVTKVSSTREHCKCEPRHDLPRQLRSSVPT
jgi:hypothetical protein